MFKYFLIWKEIIVIETYLSKVLILLLVYSLHFFENNNILIIAYLNINFYLNLFIGIT